MPSSTYTLLLIVNSLLLRHAVALYNTTRPPGICSSSSGAPAIYIIADMHPATSEQRRVAQHVRELSALFSPTVKPIIISPILARKCKDDTTSSSYDKGHGSNLAHWSAWNDFARNSEACSVIVFEYDVFPASATSSSDALVAARALNESEFLFLGYCFKAGNHPAQRGAAPYCLHAYAASLSGVRKLLDHVDVCGLFADTQVADMCNRKLLRWNFTSSAAYDRAYVQRLFHDEGLHNGPFQFSGSFVQAKYDAHPSSLGLAEGSLVSVKSKGRSVFALRNNHTWHKIDSMPAQGGKKLRVHVISDWQFRQWEETN